jgi:hypothetical protein
MARPGESNNENQRARQGVSNDVSQRARHAKPRGLDCPRHAKQIGQGYPRQRHRPERTKRAPWYRGEHLQGKQLMTC